MFVCLSYSQVKHIALLFGAITKQQQQGSVATHSLITPQLQQPTRRSSRPHLTAAVRQKEDSSISSLRFSIFHYGNRCDGTLCISHSRAGDFCGRRPGIAVAYGVLQQRPVEGDTFRDTG